MEPNVWLSAVGFIAPSQAEKPQIAQIDADSIAPSQGCITRNTKVDHRNARKGIAFESGRRVAGTVSDFVVTRYLPARD